MRCAHYCHGARCPADGTKELAAPGSDDARAPMCRKHAELVLAEYREKLDPGWRLVGVDEWGRVRE